MAIAEGHKAVGAQIGPAAKVSGASHFDNVARHVDADRVLPAADLVRVASALKVAYCCAELLWIIRLDTAEALQSKTKRDEE